MRPRHLASGQEGRDYAALDEAICQQIERVGTARHPTLDEGLLRHAAALLGMPFDFADTRLWRLVDRRLQAMRRGGRIRHVREVGLKPRWEVVVP